MKMECENIFINISGCKDYMKRYLAEINSDFNYTSKRKQTRLFIKRSVCKRYLLEKANDTRWWTFTQVSGKLLEFINGKTLNIMNKLVNPKIKINDVLLETLNTRLKCILDRIVHAHPSIGNTIKEVI